MSTVKSQRSTIPEISICVRMWLPEESRPAVAAEEAATAAEVMAEATEAAAVSAMVAVDTEDNKYVRAYRPHILNCTIKAPT